MAEFGEHPRFICGINGMRYIALPHDEENPMYRYMTKATVLAVGLLFGSAQADDRDGVEAEGQPLRYHVVVLRSLGGTSSVGTSINDLGWVAGRSNLPGNSSRHATLWRDGALTDLGTLGGPNSAVLWPVKNLRGIVSGIAQTAEPDPQNEFWSCSFFFPAVARTGYRCVGFRWQNGVMTALPTLGGKNGFATGTNNAGFTVGWAQNTTIDPTCVASNRQQFRAVIWGPSGAVSRELPPLAGDSTSAATAINDRGQVIGISGICDQAAGRFSAAKAVLWENGVPMSLGSLGGVAWNTPMAINERGDVVGFGNASAADGGEFNPRAFLWSKGKGLQPLAALPGHITSQAIGVNARRQIVGQSCDADGNCRAVLWRGCEVTDLNAVIEASTPLVLTTANDINDLGRITGQAFDTASSQFVAFVATPVRR
jgi:probable HAF family extracellular repeat protein